MPHSIFILKITVQLQYREERWFEGNTESSQLQGNFLCGTCSSSSKMAAQSLTTEPTFLVLKTACLITKKKIAYHWEANSEALEQKVKHFYQQFRTFFLRLNILVWTENMGSVHNLQGMGGTYMQLNGQHAQLRGQVQIRLLYCQI